MYQRERVEEERQVWQRKPQIRLLKADYYARIMALLPRRGRVVEIGSGCGGLKEFFPETISSDIFPMPWVDLVMTAEALPLADASVDALVGIDVLHHLERPLHFFREAARVLREGGKLVLIDPYVSAGSWIPWHWLHHEACSMREAFDFSQPFRMENNARATLWFERYAAAMDPLIRPLQIERKERLDVFYYPLVGGFKRWSLIPAFTASAMLHLDRRLERRLGRWLGYRVLLVMGKDGG